MPDGPVGAAIRVDPLHRSGPGRLSQFFQIVAVFTGASGVDDPSSLPAPSAYSAAQARGQSDLKPTRRRAPPIVEAAHERSRTGDDHICSFRKEVRQETALSDSRHTATDRPAGGIRPANRWSMS